MSSIERAMDKLAGADSDEGVIDLRDKGSQSEASPKQAADAADHSVAAEVTEDAAAVANPPEGIELKITNLLEDEQADSVDDAAADASPASVAPSAPAPVAPVSPAAPAARGPLPGTPADKAKVVLDFERLAAAGHLIPDASVITRSSEEYQQIKRRLLGNLVEGILNTPRPKNLIMVTSSLPGEGKTFTTVNLALSLTMEVDHTILAIDTDIVKRDLSRAFGVENYPGLYDLLGNDKLRLEDLLVRTSLPNLVLLPAGQDREASTERLASSQMRALTDELASRYHDRVVLFDSPPILATTTAGALAPLVGQLIIVVEAARTKQETVRESLQRLEGVRITGMILNKSRQPATRAYDYYGYYYRSAE